MLRLMRRALGIAALLLAVTLAPVQAAAAPAFRAGAAVVDITPPAFDAAADAAAFPLCPAEVFSGPRTFALQEPYLDVDGSGFFNYPEPFCDANTNARYDGLYLSGASRPPRPAGARPDRRAGVRGVVGVLDRGRRLGGLAGPVRELHPADAGRRAREAARHHRRAGQREPQRELARLGRHLRRALRRRRRRPVGHRRVLHGLPDRPGRRTRRPAPTTPSGPRPLHAEQVRLPATLSVNLSHNFPTTDDAAQAGGRQPEGAASCRPATLPGTPVFTVMSLAAHNQEIGHSARRLGYDISGDWPGYFHARARADAEAAAWRMFLVGDNGSIEDPWTEPRVSQKAHPECNHGCYAQTARDGRSGSADAVAGRGASAAAAAGGDR